MSLYCSSGGDGYTVLLSTLKFGRAIWQILTKFDSGIMLLGSTFSINYSFFSWGVWKDLWEQFFFPSSEFVVVIDQKRRKLQTAF